MTYTKGPWSLEENRQHPGVVWDVVGPSEVVAGLDGICQPHRMNDRTFAEDKANMVLISAAPELLDALQLFVSEYVELVESGDAGFWDAELEAKVIKARAAIAKATCVNHDK